ncbi:PREDICTED: protein turtle homolog A-like [Cyprinodon variegatus]|uniref:Immunoglobulin superfamily, member 9a n=1 Tax=Cyprinodon variegatus TaxID=28743 RepID=A0A3Q2GM30_CYPVA|nr:PREDICTED: protein turtle homolog A-like [Cyprinodon variegatus]
MGSGRSYRQTFTAVVVICHFLTTEGIKSEVRGKVGDSVELECSFLPLELQFGSSASPHVVEWVRQGLEIPVLIQYGSYPAHIHPHFEGRVSLGRTTNLRLERLQLDDQGLYDCRILVLDKPAEEVQSSNWTLLSVTAPPSFTKAPPPVVQALVGSFLSLDCAANGNPAPTITWLKDGSVIPSINYQGGALSLPAVTTQSAGLYACHASNSEGNVSRVTTVKIKGPPVIIVPPENTTLNMSQNALLQCQAKSDPPNMTYVWQKGGENVHHIESLKSRVRIQVDGTLHISRLVPEDSGNYTCIPTNGLLTPPTASAILTIMHPAKALPVPQETYLPTGMGGVIPCPVAAQPPLLHVNWIKDGEPLDLSMYPGWTLKTDGSLVMATVNEDAEGTYTCTPYNSYGSMGPSGPTRVILQDPPSFSITPEKVYRLDAGRRLLIPCQGNADATAKVTWSKVDPVRPISYSIEPNGSLLLQPLLKDHQGEWECSISNRVASIKTRTQVFVLGTSPHAATSLSVSPGVKQANLSWEAGFDGGSTQTFSVWVKKVSTSDDEEKQDWITMTVPSSSGTSFQVLHLSPATNYQFSVMSQNLFGAGPFSEIATSRTLDPPGRSNKPKPPTSLSANQSSAGVILQWSLPEAQQPPITGFVLQSRTAEEEWFNLEENISANSTQILVVGLQKERVYELRMLSRRGELLSEPSPSVNVSTTDMESYAADSRILEFVPEPLLAGILAGMGFMLLAMVLLLGSACVVSRRRDQRRRKKDNEPLPAIYKCSPSMKTSGSNTPDSLLKKSLLPASSNLYPTMSSTTSSSQTDCSSLRTDNNRQRKNLESFYSRGSLTKTTSLFSPSIELISRGPDGRFTLSDYDTISVDSKRISRIRRSVSLHLEKEEKKEVPYVLSVDVPPFTPEGDSAQICSMGHLPPLKESYVGSPDEGSLYSNSSLGSLPRLTRGLPSVFPVLPHLRANLSQPSTTASTLVLQMEHERETGNLSRCLSLAQERKKLERELRRYTLERNSFKGKTGQTKTNNMEESDGMLMWEYKSKTLPNSYRQGSKERSSHLTSSSENWEPHLFDSKLNLNQFREHMSKSPPLCPTLSPYSSESNPLLQLNGARNSLGERSTPPHQRGKIIDTIQRSGIPRRFTSYDHQTMDEFFKPQKEKNLSIDTFFHSNKASLDTVPYSKRPIEILAEPTSKELCVEMSVDEPEFEGPTLQPTKPMLHHRIASHVQHGCSLSQTRRHQDMRRSTSFNCSRNASVDSFDRARYSQQLSETEFWKARHQGSRTLDRKQRSQSLDLRRQKKSSFLTPTAWIDSLSQENCSVKYSQTEPEFSPAEGYISKGHSPQVLTPNPDVPYYCQPSPSAETANNQTAYQETTKSPGFVVSLKQVSTYLPPVTNDLDALEVETASYEGVPDSGGSYSSYASSGRGSMETTNGRLSSCALSPTLTHPLETAEDTQRRSEDKENGQTEPGRRRQLSVDENYEWDAADICSQPGEENGILPTLNPLKPAANRSLPSMQRFKKAEKCSSKLSSLPGHQSRCSAEPEPDAVLF